MSKIIELLQQERFEELWQACCGYIELPLDQIMTIQRRLLMEQIELLKHSELGRKIFNNAWPETVEDFLAQVPLTTYTDYNEFLPKQNEDSLPAKPAFWQHTSGRSAEYPFTWESIKWVPVTQRFADEESYAMFGCAIFASCKNKGDIAKLKNHLKFIYAVAPRPYTSGGFAYIVSREISNNCMPPLEEAEKMEFEQRIKKSFDMSLSKGFDFYFGVSVALMAIGEMMKKRMEKMDIRPLLTKPRATFRIMKGLIKSKREHRPMLPKDLWDIKGIIGSGTDGTVFKEPIKSMWGRYPLDIYTSTEGGVIATQIWDFGSMVFIPNLNFLEFISESEYTKWQQDNTYKPKAICLDKVKAGGKYELVITNLHGGALVRYRTGDVVQITSLSNEALGIHMPQMAFVGRVDDIIDIGGFIRLTEKVIWQAVENTNIPYVDWTASKETVDGRSVLHLYVELKEGYAANEQQLASRVYQEIVNLEDGFLYGNMESILNTNPIKVTVLPRGAFAGYFSQRKSTGADLAHLKPHHINPSEKELELLVSNRESSSERISATA